MLALVLAVGYFSGVRSGTVEQCLRFCAVHERRLAEPLLVLAPDALPPLGRSAPPPSPPFALSP